MTSPKDFTSEANEILKLLGRVVQNARRWHVAPTIAKDIRKIERLLSTTKFTIPPLEADVVLLSQDDPTDFEAMLDTVENWTRSKIDDSNGSTEYRAIQRESLEGLIDGFRAGHIENAVFDHEGVDLLLSFYEGRDVIDCITTLEFYTILRWGHMMYEANPSLLDSINGSEPYEDEDEADDDDDDDFMGGI